MTPEPENVDSPMMQSIWPLPNEGRTHDPSENFDDTDKGRRVRLIRTSDPYTELRPGAEGTATQRNYISGLSGYTLFVRWDSGSSLGLLEGVDEWEFTD